MWSIKLAGVVINEKSAATQTVKYFQIINYDHHSKESRRSQDVGGKTRNINLFKRKTLINKQNEVKTLKN